jgi:23S rRNA (guanosine2251-2'-O)-methyltransferase
VALIEGRQPVREALRAGRRIERILIADGAHQRGALAEIVELARAAKVRVERVPRTALDARAESRAHQGVIAEAEDVRSRSWREGVERAQAQGVAPLLVALDGISDPQNLGAILRSAEVLGAHAALVPQRRSAGLGPGTLKAAAGAVEHLPVDVVPNLERALDACKKAGIWVIALAGDAETTIDACDLLGEPCVVVIGSEGTGVTSLIRARSDAVVRIPSAGRVESLNASAAAAIALWEAARRRGFRKY